jgi:hypothetical protein
MNDPSEKYLLSGVANAEPITWVDVLAGALPVLCVLLLCFVILVFFRGEAKRLRGPVSTFFWIYVGYIALIVLLWKAFSFAPQFAGIALVAPFLIALIWLCLRLK